MPERSNQKPGSADGKGRLADPSGRCLAPIGAWTAVAALTLLALGLRLGRLGAISLWYDEAFGLLIARMPWAAMNRALALDVHPPLWFWLLHLWGTHPVIWARLLGVLLGTATVPLAWALMRRPLGEGTALTAALLLAVQPVHLYHSQELRMYALVGLLALALVRTAMALATEVPRATLWAALALLGWAMMMTQYLAGAAVGGVWLGLLAARGQAADRRWLVRWLLSGAAALGGVVPWLVWATAWHMVVGESANGVKAWPEYAVHLLESTLGLVRRPPWEWLGVATGPVGRLRFDLGVGLALIALAVAGAVVLVREPGRRAAGWVLAGAVGGGTALLLLYQALGFLFFARHYVVLLVPLVTLWAAALGAGPVWWRAGGAACLAVVFLSHALAAVAANGAVRDVTADLTRWVEVRGVERTPPLVCTNVFLALPLRVTLPGVGVHLVESDETTPAQRMILGESGLVRAWPEAWRGRPVWLAISDWGHPPLADGDFDREELVRRARAVARDLGAEVQSARIVHTEAIAGGFKWAVVVELTPESRLP